MQKTGQVRWYAIVALVCGCGGEGVQDRSMTVVDSAGVEIVTNTHAAWDSSSAWHLSTEPMLEIGQVEGAPEYEFHQIGAAVRLTDGSIVVADASYEHPLRFFSAAGTMFKSAGRRGSGPGEFQRIAAIQRLPGDTLIVSDGSLRRVTLVEPGATVLRTLTALQSTAPSATILNRQGDGNYVGVLTDIEPIIDPSVAIRRTAAVLVSIRGDGTHIDTVGTYEGAEVGVTNLGSGGFAQGIVPYGHTFSWALGANGIFIGTGDRMAFDLVSSTGSVIRSVRAPTGDLTITTEDLELFRSDLLASLPDEGSRAAISRYLDKVAHPDSKPAYWSLEVDADGNVWLGPYRATLIARDPWHVFTAEGKYLGSIRMPERFDVLDIGTDYVLGQWRDDLGVERLRIYELVKG